MGQAASYPDYVIVHVTRPSIDVDKQWKSSGVAGCYGNDKHCIYKHMEVILCTGEELKR